MKKSNIGAIIRKEFNRFFPYGNVFKIVIPVKIVERFGGHV